VALSAALLLTLCAPVAARGDVDRPLFLVLLVDTSGSMRDSDPQGATQHAVLTGLELVAYERPFVSVLQFSGEVNNVLRPTRLSPEKLASARADLAKQRAGGQTQLLLAVQEAIEQLQRNEYENCRKVVFVLSDGQIPEAQHAGLRRSAETLASDGVELHAIGLGVQAGQHNILEELTGRTGGLFFAIAPEADVVATSCRAAVDIALRLMPNNIFLHSDAHSPLRVPKEARRLIAVVPKGSVLRGPGAPHAATGPVTAGESVRASATGYAGWQVVVAERPDDPEKAARFWHGPWTVVDDAGRRATAWAFLCSDLRIQANTVEDEPSAEWHVRVEARVDVASGAAVSGPYRLRGYLKPLKGPAYQPVQENITDQFPLDAELELPPVQHPGEHELVAQVLNAKGIIVAAARKPVKIVPSSFLLVIKASSPGGAERTIYEPHSGSTNFRLGDHETMSIHVEPTKLYSEKELERFDGGLSVIPRNGKPSTRKLVMERSGPVPRLTATGLACGPARLQIDVSAMIRSTSKDPILNTRTLARRKISASWCFSIDSQPSARRRAAKEIEVLSTFRRPADPQQERPVRLAFDLVASNGAPARRMQALRQAAEKVDLLLDCPDGAKLYASRSKMISDRVVGPIEHRDGDQSGLAVRWDLLNPQVGEYLAHLTWTGKELPGLTLLSAGGRFKVGEAWVSVFIERVNRNRALLVMQREMTFVNGDQVRVIARPTKSFPPRLFEYVNVEVLMVLDGDQIHHLRAKRVGRHWEARPMALRTGKVQIAVNVDLPTRGAIQARSTIAVRPIVPTLIIKGLDGTYPHDAAPLVHIVAVPEDPDDMPFLVREEQLKIELVDETGVPVSSQVTMLDQKGRATVELSLPRPGDFKVLVKLGDLAQTSQALRITEKAVAFRLLATEPEIGQTSAELLGAPVVPQRVKPTQPLTPAIIPTQSFPVSDYRIVKATALINGHEVAMTSDGMHRWYKGATWQPERDGELRCSIEVVLARVQGKGGIMLRQEFVRPIRLLYPWHRKHRWPILLAAALAAAAVMGCRYYLALGDVRVSLVDPFVPELHDRHMRQPLLLRVLAPRLCLRIGVGRGDLAVPQELGNGQPGPILTLRRSWSRRLMTYDKLDGQAYALDRGQNRIRVGSFLFRIEDHKER